MLCPDEPRRYESARYTGYTCADLAYVHLWKERIPVERVRRRVRRLYPDWPAIYYGILRFYVRYEWGELWVDAPRNGIF